MAQELMVNKKPALGGWAMLIFWWAMILFALQASTHMVGAGDTWVAMACGRHFLSHGVNTVEPFSANSHKPGPTPEEVKTWPKWAQWITDKVGLETVKFWHPTGWVDQNWLTHVFFYWLTHLSPVADAETFDRPIIEQKISYDSLVYWKYALYIVTIIVVYYTGRVLGANPALSASFACFALFVGRSFFDVRPAGFTNLLTAVLLFIFVLTINRNYLYIWLIVPITILWCNLHGGYVYVFIALVPLIGLHLLQLLPRKTSMCIYFVVGWLFFYALAVKFRSHEYLKGIAFHPTGLLYFILILIAGNIILTYRKNEKTGLLYAYQTIGTFIVFIATSAMFYPAGLDFLIRQQLSRDYINDSRDGFFVSFIGFLIIAVLLTKFRNRLKMMSWKSWWHTVAAAFVAFIAMILANPFRLTNLTHTFVVTVSENAKLWKTVNEWHPAFEWSNPVGTAIPFLYMYILMYVLLAIWVVCLLLKPQVTVRQTKSKIKTAVAESPAQYEWPMIDLPLLAIAGLTIYMAIGSRRFIPIGAVAACPIMAMFLDTSTKMITSLQNRKQTGVAVVRPMPKIFQYCLGIAAFLIVAFLSVWWGYWYKVVYLNPWPDSDFLTSVFMRMTASYVKPFKACQFVRDNHLKGIVFNYWTEGGFVAYGQFPDPNTGKTPLQLYMDGRAQAAYNTDIYQRWMLIMSGGEPVRLAQNAGRDLTASDYAAVGDWLDKQFEKEKVGTVFMPSSELNSVLVRGLEASPNWRPVYIDEDQRIFVDVRNQGNKGLFAGIFSGETKFPDAATKLLTMGYNLLRMEGNDKTDKGFECMVRAFMQRPSQVSVLELLRAAGNNPRYQGSLAKVLNQCFDDIIEKKEIYKKQDGYREKLVAALMMKSYLENVFHDNPAMVNKFEKYSKEFAEEQQQIGSESRW
ncbi:MAG: hypothetical protein ABSE89_01875 [Sedimentisphaerales bacterium]